MSQVRVLPDDTHFQTELAAAGQKLVVVDFTAAWCPPCRRIAPVFQDLSTKYQKATFLTVDVDQCPETAQSQGVTSMPTFIFYRNKIKIDRLTGADPSSLEVKIVQLLGTDEGGDSDVGVVGHMDLITFITKSECECLNESDDNGFVNCLNDDGKYLESDCDDQMIMNISFNRAIKLHSLRIKGPDENGPKNIKIFINQPKTLDFDQALKMEPTQSVELSKKDLLEGNVIPLRFVKFQNIQNLQVFFKDNQNGSDVTRIDHLCFIGSPLCTTNMGDFKRVTGKKGESH